MLPGDHVSNPGCNAAAWLLLSLLSVSSLPARAQTAEPAPSKAAAIETTDASAEAADTEPPEGELAPASVQIDVSKASKLIQVLYAATRETKVQPTLDDLAQAKTLIDSGADLKATDSSGRTALHWAIFGSSYASKSDLIVAYEETAAALITRGVDINHEDVYNDTALDYLLYSPNFEMQTLLIEHGATSGFLAASFNFINQLDACQGSSNPSGRASANHSTNGHSFPAAVSIAQDPQPEAERAAQQQPSQSSRVAMFLKADLAPGQTIDLRWLAYRRSHRSCRHLSALYQWRVSGLQARRITACSGNQDQRHNPVRTKSTGQVLAAATGAGFFQRAAQERKELAALLPGH
jgi:Ankyrin repeat